MMGQGSVSGLYGAESWRRPSAFRTYGRAGGLRKSLGEMNAADALFGLGLVIWLTTTILMTSTSIARHLGSIDDYLKLGGIFLVIIGDLLDSRHMETVSPIAFAVIAFLVLDLLAVDVMLIAQSLIIAFCARNRPIASFIRLVLIVEAVVVSGIVLSSLIGIIPNELAIGSERQRYLLGFGWATFLSHYYLNIVCLLFVYRNGRLPLWVIAVLMALNVFIFDATHSNNSFLLTTILLAVCFLIEVTGKLPSLTRPMRLIVVFSFVACAAAAIFLFLCIDWRTAEGRQLNVFFHMRPQFSQTAYELYGIHPLSNKITWVHMSAIEAGRYLRSEWLLGDCSYVRVLLNYGVIFFAVILALLTRLTKRVVEGGFVAFAIVLPLFALHSIMDPQLLELHYSFYLLLLGYAFLPKKAAHAKMQSDIEWLSTR